MLILLICVLVILAFLIVRKHPTLAGDWRQSVDEFRKVLEQHLSRLGEEIYWSQYESGNSQNWEKRWKQAGPVARVPFWAQRKSWRLFLGRMLRSSPY